MKSKTKKLHDRSGGKSADAIERFNIEFPVGSEIWYWTTLPFGPVFETTVRGEAFVSHAGMPVAFIKGVAGCVSIFNITELKEDQREHVRFVTPHMDAGIHGKIVMGADTAEARLMIESPPGQPTVLVELLEDFRCLEAGECTEFSRHEFTPSWQM